VRTSHLGSAGQGGRHVLTDHEVATAWRTFLGTAPGDDLPMRRIAARRSDAGDRALGAPLVADPRAGRQLGSTPGGRWPQVLAVASGRLFGDFDATTRRALATRRGSSPSMSSTTRPVASTS
jgi:hypothetical protein